MKSVVLFSGGRTSGYMLRRLLDEHSDFARRFVVIFSNTGKERPETLDFVHEVEQRWQVPIVWLEYCRVAASAIRSGVYPTPIKNRNLAESARQGRKTHWFRVVDYQSASRNGEPFDELLEWMSVLPNVRSRACSSELKIRSSFRYLFDQGYTSFESFIGIRKDEEHRAIQILSSTPPFNHPVFPLVTQGISVNEVNHFWSTNDFDLQLEPYEGNCDLCFLKAKHKRIRIMREHPNLADWWLEWERKKAAVIGNDGLGCLFREGQPYASLLEISKSPTQEEFCFGGGVEQDIPCSCAEKGFSKEDDDAE